MDQRVEIDVYQRTRPTVGIISHTLDLPLRGMAPERLTEVYARVAKYIFTPDGSRHQLVHWMLWFDCFLARHDPAGVC
jgi:hypothetical protein